MTEATAAQDTRPGEDAVALVRACLDGDATGVSRVIEHCSDPARASARTAEIAASIMQLVAAPKVLVDQQDLRQVVGPILATWQPGVPVPDPLTRLVAASVATPPSPSHLLDIAASIIAPQPAPDGALIAGGSGG